MRIRMHGLTGLLVALVLLCAAPASQALILSYQTPAGAKDSDGDPVSATADVSTTAGVLTITLTNQLHDPHAAGQLISDFGFTLANSKTGQTFLVNGTISGSQGVERTINADGTFNISGAPVAAGWALQNNVNGGYRLCDLCPGGDAPAHTIIGEPSNDGVHYTGNSSITNGSHSPYLFGHLCRLCILFLRNNRRRQRRGNVHSELSAQSARPRARPRAVESPSVVRGGNHGSLP